MGADLSGANTETHAVTGAFGYSGKYIAERLLAEGRAVVTLTNSPLRANPFGDRIRVQPFHFNEPEALADSLRGVSVLYNTYWVRFNHRSFSHADAVRNTETLFRAAKLAGVARVVHVSITNPSEDSPLEYFRCKARMERTLVESGLSHAHSGRPSSSAKRISWSTTWRGPCADCPCLAFSATAATSCSPSTLMTSRSLPSSRAGGRGTTSSTPSDRRPSPIEASRRPSARLSGGGVPSYPFRRAWDMPSDGSSANGSAT